LAVRQENISTLEPSLGTRTCAEDLGTAEAFSRFGQIAVAIAVEVEPVAVHHEPAAVFCPRTEHQQGIVRGF
jgi:hypothetical protein